MSVSDCAAEPEGTKDKECLRYSQVISCQVGGMPPIIEGQIKCHVSYGYNER